VRPETLDAIAQIPPPPTDSSQILSIEIPPMTQLYGTESTGSAATGEETPVGAAPTTSLDNNADGSVQPEEPLMPKQYLPNWILSVFQPKEATQ